jgi:hypothetical protein
MKPFIVVLALVFGLGLVGVAMATQSDPFAFTSVKRSAPANPTVTVRSATAPRIASTSRTIWLDEVTVVGEFEVRQAPTRRHAPVLDPVTHVATAPCVDGAYRKLEDERGVKLSCPAPL